MDAHTLMTEQAIQNYLSNIDFKNGNFSVTQIKSDIQRMIGEIPAVKVKWNAGTQVNEMTGVSARVETVESITIGLFLSSLVICSFVDFQSFWNRS